MRAAVVAVLVLGACGGSRKADDAGFGLPPIARPWSLDQQQAAARTITALCQRGPTAMPGYGSPAFSRLVAADNRTTIAAAPVPVRHEQLTAHTGALLESYQAYVNCGRLGEAMAVNAALLEGYAAALSVSRAMRDAAPEGSKERAAREAGLDRMIAGLDGGIASTVAMLADVSIPGVVPVEVGGRLGASIALVRAELPADTVDDSVAALAEAARAVEDPDRRAALVAAAAAAE